MSWLSSFLHPGRAYKHAQHAMERRYNEGQGYIAPYNQQGQAQYNILQEMINKLKNPASLRDEWEKGYNESEASKNARGMAQEHGLNAAASLGLMGSSPALSAIQAGTSQISAEDKQNYLKDLMDKYKEAIGLSSDIYKTGAGAAGQQSTNAMNMGENESGLTFGQHNAGGQSLANIGNALMKLLGGYFSGGFTGGGK